MEEKRVWLVTAALTGKVATGNSYGWLESRQKREMRLGDSIH